MNSMNNDQDQSAVPAQQPQVPQQPTAPAASGQDPQLKPSPSGTDFNVPQENSMTPQNPSPMDAIGLTESDESSTDEEVGFLERYLGGVGIFLKVLFDWVILPLSIVVILHLFVFQAFRVDGKSMEPTLQNADYLIVSKVEATVARHFHRETYIPERGEIVIFKFPNNPSLIFVKRVIALPGERVVVKNGVLTVFSEQHPNGFNPDTGEYGISGASTLGDDDRIIPKDSVYVIGDNRHPSGSYDSREWGPVPSENIIGKAVLRLLPLDAVKTFGITEPLIKL